MTRTPQPDGYNVYSTVTGKVLTTRWEDPKNHKTGFGYYVKIQAEDGNLHYYVHLDENYGNGFNEDNNFGGKMNLKMMMIWESIMVPLMQLGTHTGVV